MSKGYLVMAQGKVYANQAEHLARSINGTQSSINKISVITDQEVDSSLFDRVISITDDLAINTNWKIENRVNFYDLTPYDETVILDADMLFLSDVSHWWSLFEKYDLLLTNKVLTYRGTEAIDNYYRKAFVYNDLPNVYSAFTYFKKSEAADTFFKLVKSIVLNWDEWTNQYVPIERQRFPSIDLAMSLAIKILDIEDEVTCNLQYPTFTHMKGNCQGWTDSVTEWSDVLGVYRTPTELKLGPFPQTGILHYVKKDFV